MSGAVLPVGSARNHGERTRYRLCHHLLGVAVDNDWTACACISGKAVAIQSLTRQRPFDRREPIIACGFVTVLDGGRLNLRHPRCVRICLRGHVLSVGTRCLDHLDHHRRLGERRAVEMYHLQRSSGFASEREDFSKSVDAWSYVNVYGSLRPSRDRKHTNQLFARCGWRVGKTSANADSTFTQTRLPTITNFTI